MSVRKRALTHIQAFVESISSVFTSGGNAVESNEGVKTGGSTGQDSSPAKGHEAADTEAFLRDQGIGKTKGKNK